MVRGTRSPDLSWRTTVVAVPLARTLGRTGTTMAPLAFRSAQPEDVAYLIQLRLRTIHEHIRNAGTDLSFEEHELRATTRLPSCEIVLLQGRVIGMIKVVRSERVWEIEQFQIEPEFQRQGLGTRVIRRVQAQATAAAVRLKLAVLSVNPAARLYLRTGFVALRETGGVIEMESVA